MSTVETRSAVRAESNPAGMRLLSSVQMARFVASGMLRLDAVVPEELNAEAIATFGAGRSPAGEAGRPQFPDGPFGTSIPDTFAAGSLARRLVELPEVAGAIHSLVGTDPLVDHFFVHVREPHEGVAQALHADAIIDVRLEAFDVQIMYYPQEVTLEMGGTLSVPGSHLRRINGGDVARYQNLRGQTRLTCPAGTIVFVHHGIWHGGRRNDSDVRRYMFKIRFNPTVRQLRLWDTSDLDDPAVAKELSAGFGWTDAGSLDLHNRIMMWRALTGDNSFDVTYLATRIRNHPIHIAPSSNGTSGAHS